MRLLLRVLKGLVPLVLGWVAYWLLVPRRRPMA
jgi:hypothetical protein